MNEKQISDYARRLRDSHGDKAELVAAQKAKDFEARNKADDAEDWKRIRAALRELRDVKLS
ncbi:MAG: hypothetical protein OEU46_13100 [Alphaproteobacteria bacterium]|nr:hypothetical protein [Alphaproteobacteria bacterium]